MLYNEKKRALEENMKKKKQKNPYRLLITICSILLIAALICIVFLFKGINLKKSESSKEQDQMQDQTKDQSSEKQLPENTEKEEPELTEAQKLELEIDNILKEMSLDDKVSQLFFVTPESLTGVEVAIQAGDATKNALSEYAVGGIILFSQNIQGEEQLKTMLSNLHAYSRYPLFTGVDEEGGTLVARIANSGTIFVPTFPDMQEIGNTGDPQQAYEVGSTIGNYLNNLGFNVDFAPVADVATNPDNPIIGVRSFGSDATLVSQMVAKEVEGMQSQGVSAVIKHFPGHGDTAEDSHAEAAVSYKTIDELRDTEFLPFSAGIEAGTDMVMVGHIAVPNILGDYTPSTLSEQMITGYLREELGYDGIVITDSMRMGAIVNYYDPAQAAVMVLQAGGDMILMPEDFISARQAVLDAVTNNVLTEERIDESLRRIYRVKLAN